MAKLRIYHDKDGNVNEVEHRVDEDYTKENAGHDDIKWMVVESADFGDDPPERFIVKKQKLVRKS